MVARQRGRALPRSWRSSSESAKPPRRQPSRAARAAGQRRATPPPPPWIALEHLVHDDPEALVERRLLRDPEHPRELVLAAGRSGRCRCRRPTARRPSPRVGRNASSDGSSARHRRGPAARVALGVEQIVVQRRGREDLPLLGRHRLEDPRVDVASASASDCPSGRCDQRGELQQLEVAHDRVGDVEVGVEAQLVEPPAGARSSPRAARRGAAGRSSGASRRARTAPLRGPPTPPPPRAALASASGGGAAPRRGRWRGG